MYGKTETSLIEEILSSSGKYIWPQSGVLDQIRKIRPKKNEKTLIDNIHTRSDQTKSDQTRN